MSLPEQETLVRKIKLLAVLVAISSGCGAQDFGSTDKRGAATPSQPNRQRQTRAPLVPFQTIVLDGGKLQPSFAGHNPTEIVNGLEKIGSLKKGEFETTAAFEARRTTSLAAPYVPNLKMDDVHAFVVSVSKVEDFNYFTGVGYSYDVDANDVFVYVVAGHSYPNAIGQPSGGASGVGAFRRTLPPLLTFKVAQERVLSGQHKASNRFGATVTVTTMRFQSTLLGFSKVEFIPPQEQPHKNIQPVANFKLDAALAEKELRSMKALFVFRLLPQHFLDYNFEGSRATFEDPTDYSNQERIILATADEIVLFSGLTGRIFLRLRKQE